MSFVCRFLAHPGADWSATTDDLPGRFGLFIACDASKPDVDALGRAADTVLSAGAAWISIWGPDCERFHDIIDEVHVGDGRVNSGRSDIFTTWHADESLHEALQFFVDMAQFQADSVNTWVVVAVGRADWYDQIRARLNDPGFLGEASGRIGS